MSLAAHNRSPGHCTSHSAVLYAVLSTDCSLSSIRNKNRKSCSNSFSGLIFQVLRTQRSSVSITPSVFKQKEQKVALRIRRWVFLGITQPAIHPAWTRVQKCPADPDRRHFVNSPHCYTHWSLSSYVLALKIWCSACRQDRYVIDKSGLRRRFEEPRFLEIGKWYACEARRNVGDGFVIPPRLGLWSRCECVCVWGGGGGGWQGWVCYPAVQDRAGFVIPLSEHAGLLSCCWSRAGFVIPLLAPVGLALITNVCLTQGWVCYPAVGARLGLLYHCWSRAGFVIPAVGLALIAIVWLRQGWVCYPAVRAGLGLFSRRRSKAGSLTPLLEVWFCSWATEIGLGELSPALRRGEFTMLLACIAEVLECSRKRGRLRRDRLTWLWCFTFGYMIYDNRWLTVGHELALCFGWLWLVFDPAPLFFSPFGWFCVHYDVLDVWSKKQKRRKKRPSHLENLKHPAVISSNLGGKGQLM